MDMKIAQIVTPNFISMKKGNQVRSFNSSSEDSSSSLSSDDELDTTFESLMAKV